MFVLSLFWLIDRTQSGATTPHQRGPGSNFNEWVFHIPQIYEDGASPSNGWVSYSGYSCIYLSDPKQVLPLQIKVVVRVITIKGHSTPPRVFQIWSFTPDAVQSDKTPHFMVIVFLPHSKEYNQCILNPVDLVKNTTRTK